MGKLTGTRHGDAANALFAFYSDKAHELEEAGQCFTAVALRQDYDPHAFTKEDLAEFKEMYESVTHSLLYYI